MSRKCRTADATYFNEKSRFQSINLVHEGYLMKTFVIRLLALMLVSTSLTAAPGGTLPIGESFDNQSANFFRTFNVLSNDQSKEIDNWFTKSPQLDSIEGTQADRAYNELNITTQKEIVVAVIDSGVDVFHEDLQGKIWTNKNEIPSNGIDDDRNGYVDDVHGWNFLGGLDEKGNPVPIQFAQIEATREIVRIKAKKKDLESKGLKLSKKDQAHLDQLSEQSRVTLNEVDLKVLDVEVNIKDLRTNYEIIKDLLNVPFEKMSMEAVMAIVPITNEQVAAKDMILQIFASKVAMDVSKFIRVRDSYLKYRKYYYNENYQARAEISGDKPFDFKDTKYGNNDVVGPFATHGTHVAGIIAANRHNGLGIRGIAENVKIMALRAIPDGDELDKDVALSVRYAVDNGAHIINMSFGKKFSPYKNKVDAAFKYAEKKGVLIVHLAGNYSQNRDVENFYPNPILYKKGKGVGTVGSWITVGASGQNKSRELTAKFSNYGQKNVDLFAPGVGVTSTIPGNQYGVSSGTSMACPATAGVAALVWSHMPHLTAIEVKERILRTVRSRAGLMVGLPGNYTQDVPFETLSVTGGIVDAYSAITEAGSAD